MMDFKFSAVLLVFVFEVSAICDMEIDYFVQWDFVSVILFEL